MSESYKQNKVHCNLTFNELTDIELNRIEQLMYPGELSKEGFLQDDERLIDVYENDKKLLDEHNITFKQIADRLQTIVAKYFTQLDKKRLQVESNMLGRHNLNKTIIEGLYLISHKTYHTGAQTCPFQNESLDNNYYGYTYGARDITIIHLETKQEIKFNTLLIHMIKCHQFFLSPKSSHRLCPIDVIKMFNMQPNIDYTPKYTELLKWNCKGWDTATVYDFKTMNFLYKFALKVYHISINGEIFKGFLFESRFMDQYANLYQEGYLSEGYISRDLHRAAILLNNKSKNKSFAKQNNIDEILDEFDLKRSKYINFNDINGLYLTIIKLGFIDKIYDFCKMFNKQTTINEWRYSNDDNTAVINIDGVPINFLLNLARQQYQCSKYFVIENT